MRGSGVDKEKQVPFITQSGMYVCRRVQACAPAYRREDGYACVCLLKNMCLRVCLGIIVQHMCIPVWADGTERGSVCPVVKYGDER